MHLRHQSSSTPVHPRGCRSFLKDLVNIKTDIKIALVWQRNWQRGILRRQGSFDLQEANGRKLLVYALFKCVRPTGPGCLMPYACMHMAKSK